MADQLLREDLENRVTLVTELLREPHDSGTPGVMAHAIANTGAREPSRLDEEMVGPLLDLLGSDDEVLRAQAATAIAAFPAGAVAPRLNALANNAELPIVQRHQAVDTLAMKVTKREVVGELVKLLRSETPSVVDRTLGALRDTSRRDYGGDVEAWEAWWQRKLNLNEAEWLRDRLDLVERRGQELREEILQLRESQVQQDRVLYQLSGELLAKNYQLTQESKRGALLIDWLKHSVADVRIHAMDLIRKQVTEGITPTDDVRMAVRTCLSSKWPAVQLAALELVGTMKEPQDAEVVIPLLEQVSETRLRATVLRTLGRLENAAAVDVLIAELQNGDAARACVLEAARSLGVIGMRANLPMPIKTRAITPLRERFSAAATDDIAFRETLLLAMANIGAEDALPEFVAHLASDSTELVLAAIRGIMASRSTANIDRVADRLSHPDPRVRQLAVDAVGMLGDKPEHLRALIARWNPDEEPNDAVRTAALASFQKALSRVPSSQRLEWIDKLSGQPEQQVAILKTYIDEWSANGAGPVLVHQARSMLKSVLLAQARFSEAADVLTELFSDAVATNRDDAVQIGIELLDARLAARSFKEAAEVMTQMAFLAVPSDKAAIMTSLRSAHASLADANERNKMLEAIAGLPDDLLGDDWKSAITEKASENTSPTPDSPAPATSDQ